MKREFEAYRQESAPSQEADVLAWWRKRKDRYPILFLPPSSSSSSLFFSSFSSSRYPHLARLARKYLAVPATSTEAERVFSGLSFLLTKQRMAMTGDHVNMQLFLKDKLK